jgi:Alpha/beta hydrolase domain
MKTRLSIANSPRFEEADRSSTYGRFRTAEPTTRRGTTVGTAKAVVMALAVGALAACGGGDDAHVTPTAPTGLPASIATVQNAPSGSGQAFGLTLLDLPSLGYTEQEYFVTGTANRYRMGDPVGQNYKSPPTDAQVVDGGHVYTTRFLVRRPTDPKKFNGTVLVEWMNVTLNQDAEFFFAAARDYLLAQGSA